jgi:hypothetical protein
MVGRYRDIAEATNGHIAFFSFTMHPIRSIHCLEFGFSLAERINYLAELDCECP